MRRAVQVLGLTLGASLFAVPAAAAEVPPCSFADVVVDYDDAQGWMSVVLDTKLSLPKSYAPADLVSVRTARIAGDGKIRRLLVDDLAALAGDARAGGVRLAVQSAYRSYRAQASTFREWVAKIGLNRAMKTSARPGHSEHQLGTTLDFKSPLDVLPWKNIPRWERSTAGRWLKNNAWRFGFVMSYPKKSLAQVCYDYEPWHFRYVGRELARLIQESGEPPRVWLLTHPVATPTPTPTPAATPSASPTPGATQTPTPVVSPSPEATPTDSPFAR